MSFLRLAAPSSNPGFLQIGDFIMSRTQELERFRPLSFDCRRDEPVPRHPVGSFLRFRPTLTFRHSRSTNPFSVRYLTGVLPVSLKESVAWRLESRVLCAWHPKAALGWRKLLIRKQRGIVFRHERSVCPTLELIETSEIVNGGRANGIKK